MDEIWGPSILGGLGQRNEFEFQRMLDQMRDHIIGGLGIPSWLALGPPRNYLEWTECVDPHMLLQVVGKDIPLTVAHALAMRLWKWLQFQPVARDVPSLADWYVLGVGAMHVPLETSKLLRHALNPWAPKRVQYPSQLIINLAHALRGGDGGALAPLHDALEEAALPELAAHFVPGSELRFGPHDEDLCWALRWILEP